MREMKIGDYLKSEGFENLKEVVTLIRKKEKDLSYERKLYRWYTEKPDEFEAMILLAQSRKGV